MCDQECFVAVMSENVRGFVTDYIYKMAVSP